MVGAVLALGAAVACSRGGDARDADSSTADSARTMTATPAMTAPWSTITYEQFDTYIKSLDFDKGGGKKDHDRNCTPSSSPDCANAGGKTKVDLDPEENVLGLNPGNLDPKGHVIARFRNKGKAMEDKYKIPPGETVYWLITSGKSEFVYFDASKVKQVASTFPFSQCHPPDEATNSGREADFSWCRKRSAGPTTWTDDGDNPAWISCVAGCCIAETAN